MSLDFLEEPVGRTMYAQCNIDEGSCVVRSLVENASIILEYIYIYEECVGKKNSCEVKRKYNTCCGSRRKAGPSCKMAENLAILDSIMGGKQNL